MDTDILFSLPPPVRPAPMEEPWLGRGRLVQAFESGKSLLCFYIDIIIMARTRRYNKQYDERRALREKFRKRHWSLFRKANQLSHQTNCDIYILMRHNSRYHTYQSTNRGDWPPSVGEVVGTLASN